MSHTTWPRCPILLGQFVPYYLANMSHTTWPRFPVLLGQDVPYYLANMSHTTWPRCPVLLGQDVPYYLAKMSHTTWPRCPILLGQDVSYYLVVLCTGTRLTVHTGVWNRFSVRFSDKWKTGTCTVLNKKNITSLNHVFNISSSCLSGNNHALPQNPPTPVNFLSIRRVYFHSNTANQSAKPPCLILMWVPISSPKEGACAD